MTTLAELVRDEFDPSVIYLNTASMGLPPRRALSALTVALENWRSGTAGASDFDSVVERSRSRYGGLVGVSADRVAVGSQVSTFVGLIAASLPVDSEVLVVKSEFTSVTFPFWAQHARGISVREVEFDELAASVTDRTALVAVAAVQSADGRVLDVGELVSACAATGTRIMLDLTQAAGWLPVDASSVAYTVCGGYKWLLAPRGTCFMTVQDGLDDSLVPSSAGWYAGADPWTSIYGSPLRLAESARRFDISPAWHSWVGQEHTLDLLTEIGTSSLHQHAVGLANRFRAGVGLPGSDSAIVSVAIDQSQAERLTAARVVGSTRQGRLRLAFHLYTTSSEVDAAIAAVAG